LLFGHDYFNSYMLGLSQPFTLARRSPLQTRVGLGVVSLE
jgi:hypothetical protein